MFSQRYGYKPEKEIQYESISDALRIRIWNLFYQAELQAGGLGSKRISQAINGLPTVEAIIADKLGFNVGLTARGLTPQALIEKYILKEAAWYEVYDFIEVYLDCIEAEKRNERIAQCNDLLEEEKAAYRIINGKVTPITNKSEMQTVEQAMNTVYDSVNQHLQKALKLYADRKNPDYENSIKEAICAVESMCCIITGLSGANATLGKALKKLEESGVHIHQAMVNGFSSLYGYTSDEDGIRHGGIDFKNAPAEDAKYMLVSCSAFVNYLIEKWSKVK